MTATAVLQVSELSKQYGEFTLGPISFTLTPGKILGIIGENGAGKTTLLECALGLKKPTAGTITYWGQDLRTQPEVKNKIAVVSAQLSCFPQCTAQQLATLFAQAYADWDGQLFENLCEQLQVPLRKKQKQLSTGMAMKLQLALALAQQADLLFLDEATNGLDPLVRGEILDLLLGFIQDEQRSVIITSHITGDLEQIADEILLLRQGQAEFCLPTDELLYKWGLVRCREEELQAVPPQLIKARYQDHGVWNVLVSDSQPLRELNSELVIDQPTLAEIMRCYHEGGAK